jgi:hypothetical protein
MIECKICLLKYQNQRGVNTHIRFKHKDWSVEQYYLHFMPNYCKVCEGLIPFKGEKYGQYTFCSKNVSKRILVQGQNLKVPKRNIKLIFYWIF